MRLRSADLCLSFSRRKMRSLLIYFEKRLHETTLQHFKVVALPLFLHHIRI